MEAETFHAYFYSRLRVTPPANSTAEASAPELSSQTDSPVAKLFSRPSGDERTVQKHRDAVLRGILADLVSSDLAGLGRVRTQEGVGPPRKIDPEFWYDASFAYDFRAASANGLSFDQLKIVTTPAATSSFKETLPKRTDEQKAKSRGGRRNVRRRIMSKAVELWRTDEKFRKLRNRTEQAREVKEHVLGKEARDADDMPECKLASAVRWVGEALNPLDSGDTA